MDLLSKYNKIHSQSGEDGMLEAIFTELNIKHGWCCEFGAGDGVSISNTYKLRQEGWNSVLIEGNNKYQAALDNLKNDKTHTFIKFVSCEHGETLDEILSDTPIPHDFDLLSIDIDGNDLWVWKSLKNYTPKVIIIEYNNCVSSSSMLTIQYDPNHEFQNDSYYGASAGALVEVGIEKGYRLVGYTEGLNLIFCRKDLSVKFKPQDHKIIPIQNGHPTSSKKLIKYIPSNIYKRLII
jgi:hypothetical protein